MRTLARTQFDHGTSAVALACLLFLAGGFGAGPAQAQGSVPCTAIVNDMERLACYDRALRGTAPANPPAAAAAPAPSAAPTQRQERRSDRNVRETAAPAAPVARTAPAPNTAGARTEAPAIVPIVVVGLRALPGRGATFTTEDGEIWVQTDSQSANFPSVPFAAEIKPGAMGSSFLVPKDRGRAVRVRRAEN